MPDLGAVLEAPADEVVEEVLEQPEGEQETAETETEKPAEEVKGDERLITQKWRDLKVTNPELFKEYKALYFGNKNVTDKLKDFDLDGTKGWLEEHGGREAIVSSLEELQGKAAELDDIASKMANGDPSIIADLVASSPDGFAKLAPAVAEQWAKSDPEGWGQAMSSVMAATIQQNGIPMFLERMAMYLEVGKTEQIAPMLQQLKEWAGSFQAKASAPRTQQVTQKDDGGRTALEQEKQTFFNQQMEGAVETFRQPLIAKELDSFFKRRPNDADAKELAIGTVRSQVVDRLKADQKYQDSLNALWARKDKDGALKLIKSRETAAIQEIAPKVGRTIYGNPAAAKVEAVDKPRVERAATSKTPVSTRDKFDAIYNSA